ncbi:MAG: hypothetical protein JRI36_10385 [Deltaproteobacteria bacterium]|nr:hypothetical protein [Deltaproteobacteria bacterium]
MLEGVATVTTTTQDNVQTGHAHIEVPVEKTPDVVEGKVNPVDNVEEEANSRSATEQDTGAQQAASETDGGRIIDLLG